MSRRLSFIKAFFLLLLSTISYLLPTVPTAHACSDLDCFSEEGNPPESYYFDEIFPLFTYTSPHYFKVFENEDYSRDYQALEICKREGSDRRNTTCSSSDRTCEGEVDICYRNGGGTAYTEFARGSCNLEPIDPLNPYAERAGTCNYDARPSLSRDIKGTDFSATSTSSNAPTPESSASDPTEEITTSYNSTLTYPKLQNEAYYYSYQGSPDNPITYGANYLALNQCELGLRQLLVLTRANQTKETVNSTGEWPLGWVDWGYQTQNGKTLLQIYQSLPPKVKSAGKKIVEADDDFYLNAGNLDAVSDVGEEKSFFCQEYSTATGKKTSWAKDLSQSPLYPPSLRQGYARGSICVWDFCCPGDRCNFSIDGTPKSLYYDISISQAFGGTLDSILFYYPLEQAAKIFRKAAADNQLIRFVTSASTQATPSVIKNRLDGELSSTEDCFQYRPTLTWKTFGMVYDYLNDWGFLDEDEKCPGYGLQPQSLSKEKGGALVSGNLITRFINFILGTVIDKVEPIRKHLVTVPDAMGQSISDLQNHLYYTLDTADTIEQYDQYNQGLSNIVDDSGGYLFAGKYGSISKSKRFQELYSCSSDEYSTHETSVEAYALGMRNGCLQEEIVTDSTCDGADFGKLMQDYPYGDLTDTANNIYGSMVGFLTPELLKTYAEASAQTGVPCEVLAGIHFIEGQLDPTTSLVSGRKLGTPEPDAGNKVFSTLLETAVYSGNELKAHLGGVLPDSIERLTTGLSRYNGGGNDNCQDGYPYEIPYDGCPALWEGEADMYATSQIDQKHSEMYLLYCADRTACEPEVWQGVGSLTFAVAVWQNMTKDGAVADLIKDTPLVVDKIAGGTTATSSGNATNNFFPKSCGPNTLDTALGCLPYGDNLASTLLTFVVGLSGGIALAVMLSGTVIIMTAAGDPEKQKKGKELFNAALVGLLFIIFSTTALQLIAGDIIKLPGF